MADRIRSPEDKEKQRLAQRARYARVKREMMMERGGICELCGFDDLRALEWHHRDPNEREFTVSQYSYGRDKLDKEVAKCDLICANCHAIAHRGASNG